MVSVNVGFLKIEILMLSCVLWMVVSKKLITLLCSISAVNFKLGCMSLSCVLREKPTPQQEVDLKRS
jgi:hypothetical protein